MGKRFGARSVCTCGHKGDVSMDEALKYQVLTEHDGLIGHGACMVRGCNCGKFTWAKFLPGFDKVFKKMAKTWTKGGKK